MLPGPVLLGILLPILPLVSGHGALMSVQIDGKTYSGVNPFDPTGDPHSKNTPIRVRGDGENGPITDATSPDLQCGIKASPAPFVAPANSGSELVLYWASGDGSTWVHDTGPMLAYLGECGETSCDKYQTSAKTQWAKIANEGADPQNPQHWLQARLNKNQTVSVSLPQNVKPGNYIFRHEVIAMQNPDAEFYVGCVQLKIGGNGSGEPNTTVTFPGAYNDAASQTALNHTDVYTNFDISQYHFPGGPVAEFGGANTSTPGSSGTGNMSASVSPTPPANTSSSIAPTTVSSASESSPTGGSDGRCPSSTNNRRKIQEKRPGAF